jgi:hypothetical protein
MVGIQTDEAAGHEGLSNPERRTFLGVGIGCAAPLLIGSVAGASGAVLAARPGIGGTEHVCEHAARELLRVHAALRGPQGVRGEHVRAIGTNLELMAACVASHGRDIDGELRARVHDRGEQAVLAELQSRRGEVVALAEKHGIAFRPCTDADQASRALSALVEDGVADTLRGGRLVLNRLGNRLDRQARGVVPAALRQKPGDDIGGAWSPTNFHDAVFNCGQLDMLGVWLGLAAGILAVAGQEGEAAIVALIAAIVQAMSAMVCAT